MTFDEVNELLQKLGVFKRSTSVRIAMNDLEERYAKPVEMTQEQADKFKELKASGREFSTMMFDVHYDDTGYTDMFLREEFCWLDENDLMRAWLHSELIVVKEN